jgi:hypothetical protein
MRRRTGKTGVLAAAVIVALSGPGLAQSVSDDHDAHHPEAAAPDTGAPDDAAATPMQGGMAMMSPEMMQMMMRMMGEGGMAGMMGGTPGDPMGGGMMGGMPGRPMGGGMMGADRAGPGMMGGSAMPMGPMQGQRGAMRGHGLGPEAIYGVPQGSVTEMTPARVEAFLTDLLERHGNPRLMLGEITQADAGSIIAEIVTTDGSLVQRLSFNRYPGLFRQID